MQKDTWKNNCSINEQKYDAKFVIIVFSDPTPDPGTHKITVGIVGLLLGVFFSVAGLIYYKKKCGENTLTLMLLKVTYF